MFILRLIYSFIFLLFMPVIIGRLFYRSFKNIDYRKKILERYGFVNFKCKKSIWIHSVSVGETIAIAPLVKKLIAKYPDKNFVITTMTPTGSQQVRAIYKDYKNVMHCYLPYDIKLFLGNFIRKINPEICLIMETELWPNLLNYNKQKNIYTILINARMSEKSKNGYIKIKIIIKQMLQDIDLVLAQTQLDSDRFLSLGLHAEKLKITGNLKYDVGSDFSEKQYFQELKDNFKINNKFIIVFGSTHNGEDEMILDIFIKLKLRFKITNLIFIIVPRHIERFNTVYNLALKKNLNTVYKSKLNPNNIIDTEIIIGDTMGELMDYYFLSDISFVGGSLVPHGGHNLLEPAMLQKTIISGKYTRNFKDIVCQLMDNNAMILIDNKEEFPVIINDLYNNIELRNNLSKNAKQVVNNNQGTLTRQYNIIENIIETKEYFN